MIYLRLFWEFFKTGLFSVGGGMATLPFLYKMSESTGWFTAEQLADMIAVSESTPGPIGVNMATFAGFTAAGVPGALIATAGLVTPSVVIILIISGILDRFKGNKYVDAVFKGLRPCSVGLICAAGLLVAKISFLNLGAYAETFLISDLFNVKALLLAAVIVCAVSFLKPLKKIHPIFLIAFSAAVGILFKF